IFHFLVSYSYFIGKLLFRFRNQTPIEPEHISNNVKPKNRENLDLKKAAKLFLQRFSLYIIRCLLTDDFHIKFKDSTDLGSFIHGILYKSVDLLVCQRAL